MIAPVEPKTVRPALTRDELTLAVRALLAYEEMLVDPEALAARPGKEDEHGDACQLRVKLYRLYKTRFFDAEGA